MLVEIVYLRSLQAHNSNELLLNNVQDSSIFSMLCMLDLATYLDSPLKIESNAGGFINLQSISILSIFAW